MNCKNMVLNYTVAPSREDMLALATSIYQSLSADLIKDHEDIDIVVDDFADDTILDDLDVEDPYDLPMLFMAGGYISPGVQRKENVGGDVLTIYRRSLLDIWCDGGDDLQMLVRTILIEELGRYRELSDDDIQSYIDGEFGFAA